MGRYWFRNKFGFLRLKLFWCATQEQLQVARGEWFRIGPWTGCLVYQGKYFGHELVIMNHVNNSFKLNERRQKYLDRDNNRSGRRS